MNVLHCSQRFRAEREERPVWARSEVAWARTTSFGYEVNVGTKGAKTLAHVGSLYGTVRNDQAYGVNLSWAGDHFLKVQYLRAKAVQNVSKYVTDCGQQVEVELQSGVEHPTAPSGGVHYNQIKQNHRVKQQGPLLEGGLAASGRNAAFGIGCRLTCHPRLGAAQ